MAEEKYNFTFGNESVSTFVTAFYDAVLLYGLALNETLAKGGNQSDGTAIVKAMWNKTFTGITGDVKIDANGDRIADYSLLDMDPKTNEFKVLYTLSFKILLKYNVIGGTSSRSLSAHRHFSKEGQR